MTRTLAIASPHAAGTEAGVAAFRAGGNAVDAALAAALALTVVYPSDCALGGDLIALVRLRDGRRVVVNASGPAAAATDVSALRARDSAMPVEGAKSVTVPGLVAGLHALWSLGGSRPWAAAFAAAVAHAREGCAVVPSLAAALAEEASLLGADEGMRGAFFGADGRPLAAGATLRQPALARTLEALAADGPGALYGGALGRSLVDRLRTLGSALTLDDLAAFTPELVAPLSVEVGGRAIATAPPNSQGYLLPLMLRAAAEHGIADPLGADAGRLAALFAAANAHRDRVPADPAFAPVDAAALCDPAVLAQAGGAQPRPRAGGDTVAIVAADSEGNTVSLIQSLFHSFGSGILDPATGIIAHNRGSFFSLDPASPNVIAPGKRPAHTLMPCAVFASGDGRPELVLGTMGGRAQPQILAQLLLHLEAGRAPAAALDAPRWIVGGLGVDAPRGTVFAESRVPEPAHAALARTGLPVRDLPAYDGEVGHAQAIALAPDGGMDAASDPRSEGAAAVVSLPAASAPPAAS